MPADRSSFTTRHNLAAGPVSIHERVRMAYARPLLYHYDPDFLALFRETEDLLRQVYQTHGDVVIMQGEAVLGLEAASVCAVHPGDKCLNLVSGVFGAGYARYFRRYSGREPLTVEVPYNEAIDPAQVEAVLRQEGDVRAIAVVHSETPSGTLNPIAEIAALAQDHGAITIVDAVSSLGGMPLAVDAWGVDICIAGPHKCIGAAPGSALMAIGARAWERIQTHPDPLRGSYLSLLDWKERWMAQGRFPFTVFVAQIYGLHEALLMIVEQGLESRLELHSRAARMCRAGVRALGLELWPARESIASTCVTAVKTPPGIEIQALIEHMWRKDGVAIAGSIRELEGKLFRIGHMGYMARPEPVLIALAALERALAAQGFEFEPGVALAAAQAAD